MHEYSHSVSQKFLRLFQQFISRSFIARYNRALLAVYSLTRVKINGLQQEFKEERMKEKSYFSLCCVFWAYAFRKVSCL